MHDDNNANPSVCDNGHKALCPLSDCHSSIGLTASSGRSHARCAARLGVFRLHTFWALCNRFGDLCDRSILGRSPGARRSRAAKIIKTVAPRWPSCARARERAARTAAAWCCTSACVCRPPAAPLSHHQACALCRGFVHCCRSSAPHALVAVRPVHEAHSCSSTAVCAPGGAISAARRCCRRRRRRWWWQCCSNPQNAGIAGLLRSVQC